MTLLQLQDIGMAYHTLNGEIPALSHISFSINEGEFVSLVGPSGCGKSTILNLIAGLLKPEQGAITMQGIPLEKSPVTIGYMLQKDHLFEWRTIYENVILGLEIQKKLTKDRLDRVEQLLKDYGLEDFKQARPSQLSGGMRQRAALIRTLALEPTKAPASIKCELPILLDIPEKTPMNARSAPDFKNYFNRIWKELNPNG